MVLYPCCFSFSLQMLWIILRTPFIEQPSSYDQFKPCANVSTGSFKALQKFCPDVCDKIDRENKFCRAGDCWFWKARPLIQPICSQDASSVGSRVSTHMFCMEHIGSADWRKWLCMRRVCSVFFYRFQAKSFDFIFRMPILTQKKATKKKSYLTSV